MLFPINNKIRQKQLNNELLLGFPFVILGDHIHNNITLRIQTSTSVLTTHHTFAQHQTTENRGVIFATVAIATVTIKKWESTCEAVMLIYPCGRTSDDEQEEEEEEEEEEEGVVVSGSVVKQRMAW